MEINELLTYLISPVAQIAIIIALAEVAKKLGLKSKWIPLLDIILGVLSGLAVFWGLQGHDVVSSVILGLAVGLSACGLFSGIKNVAGK